LLLSRGMRRVFLSLAVLLAVVQAWIVLTARPPGRAILYSDLTQFVLVLVAAIACMLIGRRTLTSAGKNWTFVGVSLGLLTAALALVLYSRELLHTPETTPWPADMLFFIWMAPLVMTMLPGPADDSATSVWLRALDFLQIVIVSVTVYLYFFHVATLWEAKGLEVYRSVVFVGLARDVLLAGALLFCGVSRRSAGMRRFYLWVGLFMVLTVGADLVIIASPGLGLGRVTWGSFALCVPIVVLTGLAANWKDVKEEPQMETPSKGGALVAVHVLPLVIPALVLIMARQIAREQLTIAWAAMGLSFACSGARLILTNAKLQRAAEDAERSARLLAAVSEGTTDAIYVKDIQGRYLMINRAGAEFLGREVHEVIGRLDTELLSDETGAQIMENDRATMASGNFDVREEVACAGDVTRTFLATKGPHRDTSGNVVGLIGISRDITDRLKLQKQMQQSQRLESIGNLAGGIAHDFNNLLTVIRGYCGMYLARPTGDESTVNAMQQIDAAASRAAALTSQLLAFSRRQVLQARVLNLNHIVQDVQSLLHRLLTEDIEILTVLDPELSSVKADQSQMEQVIMNLVVNARDAMPEGGKLTIETANVVLDEHYAKERDIAPIGPAVMLAISDNGQGIDKELMAHIFEPFFTTKPHGKGTGLGLSTVYGIVKQSGGYIWVYSEPGRGTSFKIYLPRADGTPAPLSYAPERVAANGSETILLVEDDEALRGMVQTILTDSGYSVLSATTPETALRVCHQNAGAIHMLLTDVIMPGMNGRELARRAAAECPNMRVLFMSGYTTNAIVHQGVLDVDVEFLQKPFTAEALRARVRQVLDGKASASDNPA